MMRRRLLFIMSILAGLTLTSVPALAAAPQDGPGCVGVVLPECIGWLRTAMRIDETTLAQVTALSRETVDVNGRPVAAVVPVYAQLPDREDAFVIMLHVQPDRRVQWVEVNLRRNLMEVHTEAAYDRSGFYEIVSRLLGRRCAGIAKLELYRFFENTVKPQVKEVRQDLAKGLFGFHRVMSRATGVPFCGGTMGYTNQVEWRGSNSPEAGRSPTTFSQIDLH